MDKTMLIKDVIVPFKTTAKMVDKKLLEFEVNVNSDIGNGGSFPYESWARLQDLKTDVTALHENCATETLTVRKNTKILSQHNKASFQCLKLIESQLSLLEDQLSKTGFVPGGQQQQPTTEGEKNEIHVLKDCLDNQQLESHISISKPVEKVKTEKPEVSPPKADSENEQLHSPQLPVFANAPKRSELVGTPTVPRFQTGNSVTSNQTSAYFNKLSSPDIRLDNDKGNTPITTSTSRSFFPVLTTPKTPELNIETNKEDEKVRPPVYPARHNHDSVDSEDEQLVMYSKDGELNKFYHDGGPPDITLTQLKMKKPLEAQEMTSPATPDLKNYGVTAMKTSTYLPCFKDYTDSPDTLQSPVEPSLLQDPNHRAPAKRRSSFWVSNDEYDELPSDMRRLFTIEQANGALYAMKMELASSSKSGLTLADIERATSLGGKTQSFILMLTTVGAVVKVPGTNRYHVNE